jgi:hypothetical protein
LAISDRQQGDTLIRQRARFLALAHGQSADGTCTATISVLVSLYAADGDGYGELLTGPGLSPYAVTLTADNQTLVAVQTGQILAIRQGEQEAAWQANIEELSREQATMLQGDFFEALRAQPINIGDMIRQHIQQADAMGRFA